MQTVGPYFPAVGVNTERSEYEDLQNESPYLFQIRKNKDQSKCHFLTFSMQYNSLKSLRFLKIYWLENFEKFNNELYLVKRFSDMPGKFLEFPGSEWYLDSSGKSLALSC